MKMNELGKQKSTEGAIQVVMDKINFKVVIILVNSCLNKEMEKQMRNTIFLILLSVCVHS